MNRRLVVCFLALVGVGCGGTPTPANDAAVAQDMGVAGDAGGCMATDAGTPPTPDPLAAPTGSTLDLSCLGTATVPAGGAATTATVEVTEYVSMQPITSTTLELYADDAITGTCTAPNCVSGMTDAAGHVDLSAPAGGWVGLHILPSTDSAEVLAYNQTWPTTAASTFPTAGFSASSISLVSSLLGRTFQTATAGAISGQVNDCMDNHLANAEARVFHGAERIVNGPSCDRTSPRITGLMGTSPTRQGFTGSGGTFVGANVPVGDDYHVEIWGVRTAGGAEELIGCEEGRVVAGAITVLVIGPLRSDYAAGSPCAMAAAAAGH